MQDLIKIDDWLIKEIFSTMEVFYHIFRRYNPTFYAETMKAGKELLFASFYFEIETDRWIDINLLKPVFKGFENVNVKAIGNKLVFRLDYALFYQGDKDVV